MWAPVVGFGLCRLKIRIRGRDAAGIMEAFGKNVTRFEVGSIEAGKLTPIIDTTYPMGEHLRPYATSSKATHAARSCSPSGIEHSTAYPALTSHHKVGKH